MSESLIFAHFLFFGERCEWIANFAQIKWAMWANRSGRSSKMRDHEQFAQAAQRKWAIVSESLRSLTKNKRMSESLIFLSESFIRSFLDKKTSNSLGNQLSDFPAQTQHPHVALNLKIRKLQCTQHPRASVNSKIQKLQCIQHPRVAVNFKIISYNLLKIHVFL